jgi:creatinine amidohydrolase
MKSILCILALSLLPSLARAAPSVFIEDLTWPEVRDAISGGATTAIYYAGSTEQNGPHLATGKHTFVARHVAGRIASELGNALVYPILPFAPTGDATARTGHMRFPGSVSLSEETYTAVARDVAASARAAGFRFVMLMGDHGGGQQALEKLAAALDRQWAGQGTRVGYVPEVYFGAERRVNDYLAARGIPPGAHASVPDTSEVMLVDPSRRWLRADKLQAGDGANGVEGDPRPASVEFGRQFIDFKVNGAVERIRRFTASGR